MSNNNSKMITETLQAIINDKAEKRLLADLRELYNYINSSRFFNNPNGSEHTVKLTFTSTIKVDQSSDKTNVESITDTLARLLVPSWGVLRKQLIIDYMPIYIKEETEAFVKKVEQLRVDVDQLFDQKADIDY